jgi:hypothetical protein
MIARSSAMSLPIAHISVSDLTACALLLLAGFGAGVTFTYRFVMRQRSAQTEKAKR